MKKVKLILTAIVAMAITSEALAYKAKKYGTNKYCYTTTTASGARCCLTINNAEMLNAGTGSFKYVTIPASQSCSGWPPCTKIARDIGL